MEKHVTFSGQKTPKQQQKFAKSRSKSRQNCRQKYTPTYNHFFLTGSANQKNEKWRQRERFACQVQLLIAILIIMNIGDDIWRTIFCRFGGGRSGNKYLYTHRCVPTHALMTIRQRRWTQPPLRVWVFANLNLP